jgi:hypothetical protein
VVVVSTEFEVNTHRVKTMPLLNLRLTGSIEDYKQQYDQLVYHIKPYDHSISGTMLTSQFLLGLKDDLRQFVEMHLPQTASQAATLAAIQEHLTDRPKPYQRKYNVPKPEAKNAGVNSELWKARHVQHQLEILM